MKNYFDQITTRAKDPDSFVRYILIATGTLIGVAVIQLALASAYMFAFHEPTPRDVPVAVVGAPETTKPLANAIEEKSDGAYSVTTFDNTADAINELKSQGAYAIYTPKFPKSTITVATANSKILADSIPKSLSEADRAYQQQARQELLKSPQTSGAAGASIEEPTVEDVAPLKQHDPNGLGMFYLAFSFVFGGYLAAVAVNLVRAKRIFNHKSAALRIVGFALFSIITSLLISSIAVWGANIIDSNSYLPVASIGALTTFGVAMFASALISLLGVLGTALVILLFVVLGTPASGGPLPLALTGAGPWHILAALLPTGAALDAIRQIVYFDSFKLGSHLWTPISYSVIGTIILFVYGLRNSSISLFESAIVQNIPHKKPRTAHKKRMPGSSVDSR